MSSFIQTTLIFVDLQFVCFSGERPGINRGRHIAPNSFDKDRNYLEYWSSSVYYNI